MTTERFTPFLYDSIDSTNEEARRLYAAGKIFDAPLGKPAYVLANHQSQGRGTQGRPWLSPEGAGLYLTVVHTAVPGQPLILTDTYTRAAGLACYYALDELFGLKIALKPVNDLYLRCPKTARYQKLAGILVESVVQNNALKAVMTGVGMNLLSCERSLDPAASRHPDIFPISLEDVLDTPKIMQIKAPEQRKEFIESLVAAIDGQYQRVLKGLQDDILAEYNQVCVIPV